MSVSNEAKRWENDRVLDLVQAMTGQITDQMKAVAMTADQGEQRVDLFFALTETTAVDVELIDNIADDLCDLAGADIAVAVHLWQGEDWVRGWPDRNHRLVFSRWGAAGSG